MKKLFSLLLLLCMLLSLAACGESGPADPNCGTYVGVYGEAYGVQVDIHDMYEKGFTIELQNGGKGRIEVDGTKAGLKWTLTGEAIHIEGTGLSGRDLVLDGTVSGGVMTLEDVMDSGVAIRLECAELMKFGALLSSPEPAPAETEPTPAPTPEPAPESDPNAGLYEGVYGEFEGTQIEIHTMYENGFTVELEDGGSGRIDVDGTKAGLTWALDGTALHIEGTGIAGKDLVLDGTLADGVMILENVLDTQVNIRLECAALIAPGSSERDLADSAANPDWWSGKWYGWGVYYVVGGTYSSLEDQAWDVVAQIDADGSLGTLQIWDIEDLNEPEFTSQVSFVPGKGEAGQMLCLSGSFADAQMATGEWVCDPADSPEGKLEHTFCLEYLYRDPENSDNYVYICYILRPWGMLWDDVANADTSEMLYEDMMPLHYEDWYLPQLG